MVRGRKGDYDTLLNDLAGQGYVRARVDGEVVEIDEFLKRPDRLARYEQHTIEVVIDRLVRRDGIERRLTDSLETALRLADGVAEVELVAREGEGDSETLTFSQHLACPVCGTSYEELGAPQLLVQLALRRMCDVRRPRHDVRGRPRAGRARSRSVDRRRRDLAVAGRPHPVLPADARVGRRRARLRHLDKPWSKLTAAQRKVVLYGVAGKVQVKYKNRYGRVRQYQSEYEGVIPWIKRRHEGAESDWTREQFEGYMREVPCSACGGARLKPATLAVTVNGKHISEVCDMAIAESSQFLAGLVLSERDQMIAERVVARDQRPPRLPARRRARLPHAVPLGRHARRW